MHLYVLHKKLDKRVNRLYILHYIRECIKQILFLSSNASCLPELLNPDNCVQQHRLQYNYCHLLLQLYTVASLPVSTILCKGCHMHLSSIIATRGFCVSSIHSTWPSVLLIHSPTFNDCRSRSFKAIYSLY